MQRGQIGESKRWVVKIGSALLTANGRGLDIPTIERWVAEFAGLRKAGVELLLVSSGAIAEGVVRLGWGQRPDTVHALQAAAAVGQTGLVQAWENAFAKHGLRTAQILLTHDDLANRKRYLNARATLNALLDYGIIPIINENDTVTTDEIKLGDNDNLAALVANLTVAELLVILTDQQGLYNADPRHHSDAQLIHEGLACDPALQAMAGPSDNGLGRGGMATKIIAAQRAARSGTATAIACGWEDNILQRLHDGAQIGTLLSPNQAPMLARKRWLANQLNVKGHLQLDQGAATVLRQHGRSLLPVGIQDVRGDFRRGELVSLIDQAGVEVARGLSNYDAEDVRRIKGHCSQEISAILGFLEAAEVIHRDNMVLTP